MSVLPIVTLERESYLSKETVLRRQCSAIEDFSSAEFREILGNLIETFESHTIAVGLSAPQINAAIQVCVINTTKGKVKPHMILANPRIDRIGSENKKGFESCMSLPHVKGEVARSISITVSYCDENGVRKSRRFNDFEARVVQHEIDHLNGLLYIDRMDNIEGLQPTDLFAKDKYYDPHAPPRPT